MEPQIGIGNVQIELGDKTYDLVPSVEAMKGVSAAYGGAYKAMTRCAEMEFDTIVSIISYGLGQAGRPSKDLPELVYEAGLAYCSRQCVRYLDYLMHGGRPPPSSEEGNAAPLGGTSPSTSFPTAS